VSKDGAQIAPNTKGFGSHRVKLRFLSNVAWLRIFASILLWAAAGASAQSPSVILERLDRGALDVPVDQVVSGAFDRDFVAGPYAAIVPAADHDVWYRLRLAVDWDSPHPPVLSIQDPQGLSVTAYAPPKYAATRYSMYDTSLQTGFSRHALVLLLPSELKTTAPIYLRVAPEKAVPRSIQVSNVLDARVADLVRARLDILFPAIQLATVLVMLCFFVALRERMYIYFVGHVFFCVVYELYSFGIGYEFWPLNLLAPLHVRPLWFAAALASILLIEFSSRFLEIKRIAPRLDRVLAAFRWPFALLALCAAIPPLSSGWWVEDALSLSVLAAAPLLIVAGVLAWQHGGRRGGFYLCAWIPGLLFVMLRVLQLTLLWPLPVWLEFAVPAGFAYASLVLAFGLADHTLSIRHERDVAHRLAEHDVLTGVLNRRAILARLRAAFVQARESGEPLALLFLDLDHFKRVNDSYGHRAGDQCLRAIIGPIASELRQGDALGRYGGEEFLVVLPGAGAANAEVVAERIRNHVQETPMLVSGTRIGLTLSVGIASLDDDVPTPDDLIERADAALYRSKSAGRNVVSTHAPLVLGESTTT
jgi:diguanylate cyclase (GGDEF)-like protein